MGIAGGGLLRLLQTIIYSLAFCCAAIILGIYSFFLAVLHDHNLVIAASKKAVEGIAGAGVLFTIFAIILTCFLGGISFFAFIAIFLDVCFIGAFIALAWFTRHGGSRCTGNVITPIGTGLARDSAAGHNLGLACRLNTAAFAVSIIGAFLFLLAALVQVALVRHHKKEKRFGPSPANNYTSGSGTNKRKFWQRKPKTTPTDTTYKHDAELGAVGVGAGGLAAHHHDHNTVRPSHDTAYTGSTVAAPGTGYQKDIVEPGMTTGTTNHGVANSTIHQNHAPHGAHGGYYTQPQGSGINPYGYENTAPTGTYRA